MSSALGFGLVIIYLASHVCHVAEARDLPSKGLLNEMPNNCSSAEFCLEKHTDYPQDIVDTLLKTKYHFTLELRHERPFRRQGFKDEDSDCEKNISFGHIYEIIDEYDNVRVVVQSVDLFEQKIRIEKCKNPGRLPYTQDTAHFKVDDLKAHNISCVDTRMDYSFLVLTRDGEGVESVQSKHGIPVCCSCKLNID